MHVTLDIYKVPALRLDTTLNFIQNQTLTLDVSDVVLP